MPLAVSIDNMVACVQREIGFRARVYPRWVSQGKLKAETAAMEQERMAAVLEALEELRLARAFQAAMIADMAAGELVTINGAAYPRSMEAWLAWCAPRHAPLTLGQKVGAGNG